MSTASAPISKPLSGEVRLTLDPKNRITIRADWREIIGGNEIYVMPSPTSRCLKLLPPPEMERLLAWANNLPGKDRTITLRKIGADSRCIRWDAQGRCVLPEEFCKPLNLSGEIVITGATQILEIWNPETRAAIRATEDPIADQNLSEYGL